MSLEQFWPSSFENMNTSTIGRTTRAKDGKEPTSAANANTSKEQNSLDPATAGRTTRAKDGKEKEPTPGANANATASKEPNSGLDPATAKAFKAMTDQLTKVIDAKMSPIVESIQMVVSGLRATEKRLDEVEERVDAVETATASCDGRVLQLEKQLKDATERLDSFEDRNRRDNIRIYGCDELLGRDNALDYFETWIPQLLKLETKSGRIKLDRCHRLGPKTNQKSGKQRDRPPPRGVIAKLHNSRDKKRVMDAARRATENGGKLQFEGSTISFYSDYSQGTLRKRKSFDDIRKQLREREVEYSTLHTGVLRIKHDGQVMLCDSPEEATAFLNSLSTENEAPENDAPT